MVDSRPELDQPQRNALQAITRIQTGLEQRVRTCRMIALIYDRYAEIVTHEELAQVVFGRKADRYPSVYRTVIWNIVRARLSESRLGEIDTIKRRQNMESQTTEQLSENGKVGARRRHEIWPPMQPGDLLAAKWILIVSDAERDFMHSCFENPAYFWETWASAGKPNLTRIAEAVNAKFHDWEEVRTRASINKARTAYNKNGWTKVA